jgi:lambda repressor-like predicted transcriptional regulator
MSMPLAITTERPPKNPAERRAWVHFKLRTRGETFASLGRKCGTSPQAIGNALMAPSARLEAIIAEAIGLTAEELFPERFDARGRRLHPVREAHRSTLSAKAQAA